MIYKIQGNFTEENFSNILEKLSKYFKYIYINNILYIALISINKKSTAINLIKRILKPAKDFVIIEITEKNIMQESDYIIDWCKDNFVALDTQRYEKDHQKKLQEMNQILDKFELILKSKMKGET